MSKPIYSRILLKLSGETLKGASCHGYETEACEYVVRRVRRFLEAGVEVAIVVGGGNLWRGGAAGAAMDRADADKMGMLATVMNSLALKDFFQRAGIPALMQSAIPMPGFLPLYDRERAKSALASGGVVIFSGGSGNPFFTTDTASVLRALEMDCDAVVKATKVDGIYSADPKKFPDAVRYDRLTFDEALERQLKVMDAAAFSLCREHALPIVVFDFFDGDVDRLLAGDTSVGTIVQPREE